MLSSVGRNTPSCFSLCRKKYFFLLLSTSFYFFLLLSTSFYFFLLLSTSFYFFLLLSTSFYGGKDKRVASISLLKGEKERFFLLLPLLSFRRKVLSPLVKESKGKRARESPVTFGEGEQEEVTGCRKFLSADFYPPIFSDYFLRSFFSPSFFSYGAKQVLRFFDSSILRFFDSSILRFFDSSILRFFEGTRFFNFFSYGAKQVFRRDKVF